MSRILALGDDRLRGLAHAGAEIVPVEGREAAVQALLEASDAGLVILTPEVAALLREELRRRRWLLWTVIRP